MEKLNQYIDHTLLKADASKEQIVKLCTEAKEHEFATVCLNPSWVSLAADELKGSNVGVCTVIGFPLGATSPQTKAFETQEAINNGATEIDMVINIGAIKSQNHDFVFEDIKAVVTAAKNTPVKVIIETALLTNDEKVLACELAQKAGAAFVKTSTGFSTHGATLEDIQLMRSSVSQHVQVKASGGVRSKDFALQLIEAGATRLGTSSGIALVNDQESQSSY